jgi:anti-sigma regulatory factor (Ser/Thr protein kinase)/putative methionine-R-sulfoxide reductase with GAF domain
MIFLGELRVQAVRENLRTISYFLHGIAQRLRLTEKTLFDIELAVEEAAVNIISHAYSSNSPGDLTIRVDMVDSAVRITLSDWGIPLDPAQVKPFDIDAPVETRIKGGMGLHLISNLIDEVFRQPASVPGEANTLTMVKQIEQLQPGAHRPSATRELYAMRTVSQFMVTGMELDELLRLIVNELVETIGAERGTLYLLDDESHELVSRVLLEETGALREIRVRVGEGIAGHVAITGQVLNIRDAYQDSRFLRSYDEMTGYRVHTVLTAPMRNPQRKVIGVVQLLNKKGGPFTVRDERLLEAMAAQAAISIENARLYQQEIQQRLLNQELETARIIQRSFLPQSIPHHVGWDVGAFWRPMQASRAGDRRCVGQRGSRSTVYGPQRDRVAFCDGSQLFARRTAAPCQPGHPLRSGLSHVRHGLCRLSRSGDEQTAIRLGRAQSPAALPRRLAELRILGSPRRGHRAV